MIIYALWLIIYRRESPALDLGKLVSSVSTAFNKKNFLAHSSLQNRSYFFSFFRRATAREVLFPCVASASRSTPALCFVRPKMQEKSAVPQAWRTGYGLTVLRIRCFLSTSSNHTWCMKIEQNMNIKQWTLYIKHNVIVKKWINQDVLSDESHFYSKTSEIKMIFDDAGLMKIQLICVNCWFLYFHIDY